MTVLDALFKKHKIPTMLYSQIKKNLNFNYIDEIKNVSAFVDDLPLNLREPLACHIY